jgi:hypothetical protein
MDSMNMGMGGGMNAMGGMSNPAMGNPMGG